MAKVAPQSSVDTLWKFLKQHAEGLVVDATPAPASAEQTKDDTALEALLSRIRLKEAWLEAEGATISLSEVTMWQAYQLGTPLSWHFAPCQEAEGVMLPIGEASPSTLSAKDEKVEETDLDTNSTDAPF